jgi:hypothetical protein
MTCTNFPHAFEWRNYRHADVASGMRLEQVNMQSEIGQAVAPFTSIGAVSEKTRIGKIRVKFIKGGDDETLAMMHL